MEVRYIRGKATIQAMVLGSGSASPRNTDDDLAGLSLGAAGLWILGRFHPANHSVVGHRGAGKSSIRT